MYPGVHAKTQPDRPAVIMGGSGAVETYRELDERSNQCAQLLYALGLRPGDSIALFLENHPRYFDLVWAAQRSGLVYTAVSSQLGPDEVAYIVRDCGAKVLFTSRAKADVASQLPDRLPGLRARFALDGGVPGFEPYAEAAAAMPAQPLAEELEGRDMLYSSGTTGRPKGVAVRREPGPMGEPTPLVMLSRLFFGMDERSVYLSPAPSYHAAPLRYIVSAHRIGATVVIMERFDARQALELIQRHGVTHSQWVPTMFVRMLKLPEEDRAGWDLSSHRCAIHAAAPCPISVKEEMIAWWGPILFEYYAGTEANGFTAIGSEEWLRRKGSVGRPLRGEVHVLDDAGRELPPGEIGTIYFAGGAEFEYHNDPEKTRRSRNEKGWSTLGDVGYLDGDGFLYLTDRKANMIISGGVNIYPQETENLLVTHPRVMDAAVFGVPDPEFGEQVKAVVQPRDMAEAGPELERELIEFCRARLSHLKCPRSVDFDPELPRHPNGKLVKRLLKDRYWKGRRTRIA